MRQSPAKAGDCVNTRTLRASLANESPTSRPNSTRNLGTRTDLARLKLERLILEKML